MSTENDSGEVADRRVLPKGTVVKLGGLPYELPRDTEVTGDNGIAISCDPAIGQSGLGETQVSHEPI